MHDWEGESLFADETLNYITVLPMNIDYTTLANMGSVRINITHKWTIHVFK